MSSRLNQLRCPIIVSSKEMDDHIARIEVEFPEPDALVEYALLVARTHRTRLIWEGK